ncbi:MAG: alpha amylase C-terminal domain-containing protein [Planctomycetota bacterium]
MSGEADITRLTAQEIAALPEERVRRDMPWRWFGAHPTGRSTVFRVYLPEATEVALLREGNGWGMRYEPLERAPDGVWSVEIPENLTGTEYKYRIRNDRPYLSAPYDRARLDPFSFQVATREGRGARYYNSVVADFDAFRWTHKDPPRTSRPMSIYEIHLATFLDANYRAIARKIVDHLGYLQFTHVQIMPPFQTPIHESWGYLVGLPYAIYNRHGSLEDFQWLVNHLHGHGLGVIVDLPLGFSIQDWDCGIAMLDGTDLFHHAGARGWNNQWRTRIYNHASPFVADYLTGIASYLHAALGVDGARIDAVASQIFKDYDRGGAPWEKNDRTAFTPEDWALISGLGGDRFFEDRGYRLSEALDLEALRFFRVFHARLRAIAPRFFTIAEESRRVFPRLATPLDAGGLGFAYAQNMGETHRMHLYIRIPTESRRIEEIEPILLAPKDETFVNAMNTHDECANGKTRLITEIKNHVQLIGLAALTWFRPGAPMLFMGDEFCEEGWFDVHTPLDWGKTGPGAALHQQEMTRNIRDLNLLLRREKALARQETWTLDRNGSNNEDKWFSFIRWGGDARWETNRPEDHAEDILFIRSENHAFGRRPAEVYVPAVGEYRVIYNSIDERYIGQTHYNRHDPYWTVFSSGHFIRITLAPFQNLALKLKR